jgi:ribonuclease HI
MFVLGPSRALSVTSSRLFNLARRLPAARAALASPAEPAAAAASAMGKKAVYAVAVGRRPGLYASWDECASQVTGVRGNQYKGFASEAEAARWLSAHGERAVEAEPATERARQAAPRGERAEGGADDAAAAGPSSEAAAAAAAAAPAPARRFARLRVEFDGASKRNPGPAGLGAVLYDADTGEVVARLARYLGDCHTNNQAEYAGLIAGLAAALDLGAEAVEAVGDSKLVVNQVLGRWRVRNEGLAPYHAAAAALRARFRAFAARQVPRALNAAADAMSNEAIDVWRRGGGRDARWTLEGHVARQRALAAAAEGAEAAQEPAMKRARTQL